MIEDIRYLIVFAKIAQIGSISGAATALGLSTATTSQHLTRLEKNLGCALLYRNTRKLSLTHDGASLLETATSMLELYEKGVIEFKQRSISTRNHLHISIPAVFINSEFTRHVASFIQDHPNVQLTITCDDSRQDIIAEGIDVAFRIGDLPDSALKARHLFVLPRRLVASTQFLARHDPIEHPKDLAEMSWIGLTMRPDTRVFHHRSGETVQVTYTSQVRVDNVEASYQLALLGVGLAAPPNYLSDDAIARNELVVVLPQWTLEPLKVYALWPANLSTSSVAYSLIKHLYDAFNGQALAH